MEKTAVISIKVTPNASKSGIAEFCDGVLKVKINAQPEKGKANKELIRFLSKELGVSKSSIAIERGETSRNKSVKIEGLTLEEVIQILFPQKKFNL